MYFYIYDSFLNHKKYDRLLADIETRAIEIGISGKINRLSMLTNIKDTIEHGVRHGAKTIVVVGNDLTFSQAANVLARFPHIALGFIPIGTPPENLLAQILSLPLHIDACNVLSARIIKKFPLGKINDRFFLLWAEILGGQVKLRCDDKYDILLLDPRQLIRIYNIPSWIVQKRAPENPFSFRTLELTIEERPRLFGGFKQKNSVVQSTLWNKKISVTSKDRVSIIVDDYDTINTPAELLLTDEMVSVIVGRGSLLLDEIETTVAQSKKSL